MVSDLCMVLCYSEEDSFNRGGSGRDEGRGDRYRDRGRERRYGINLLIITRRSYWEVSLLHYWLEMKWMGCEAMILYSKAILDWGQPELMRWISVWVMPLVQDRLLDLLTSSPVPYLCVTDAPLEHWLVDKVSVKVDA